MSSLGLTAEPDAITLLAERLEGNLLAAAQEIEKLKLCMVMKPSPLDGGRHRV